MKLSLHLLAGAVLSSVVSLSAFAQSEQSRKPVILQLPAIANGSNASRAPFPAARQFDDVRPADGLAIDRNLPPNTASTDPNPDPLPLPRVAILQPAGRGAIGTDPGLLPTGRPTVAISTGLDSANVANSIRGAAHGSRDAVVGDVDMRWAASHASIRGIRGTMSEMSASGRTQFQSLNKEVKHADKALRLALREARYASAEGWESAKTQLALAYEEYAAAIARVDVSVGTLS